MSDEAEITEFLAQDGSVQLIYAVAQPEGTLVNDIHQELDASRHTVTSLVKEARRKGIIEQVMLPGDHGNAKRYALTELGRALYDECQDLNLYTTYQELKELEKEYAARQEELTDRVTELATESSTRGQNSRVPEDFPHPEDRYPHRDDE